VEQRLQAVRDILALTGVELAVVGEVLGVDIPAARESEGALEPAVAQHCDPDASTEAADDRQAVADEIFSGPTTTC